jgi:aspartate racemase
MPSPHLGAAFVPESMRNRHWIAPCPDATIGVMNSRKSNVVASPRIGVLGGMGPLATADFLAKLARATPAVCDQDHFAVTVDSTPQIPDRVAALDGRGADPLPALLAAARRLVDAGCDLIAMPCNTAHFWHARLAAALPVPLLHIAEAVDAELGAAMTIGLIGTSATMAGGLYQHRDARMRTWLTPGADEVARRVVPGIAAVKAGDLHAGGPLLRGTARNLAARGADAVVLACTEIPLVVGAGDIPVPVVDATFALARHTIATAQGMQARRLAA